MKIAVMGYGTIGSGVVDVLRINKEKITKRAGETVDVKYILDLREFPGDPMEDAIVHDYQTIVNDPEIGITWPSLTGEYKGSASGEGYHLEDGTKLNLSDKDQLWRGLKDTFHF